MLKSFKIEKITLVIFVISVLIFLLVFVAEDSKVSKNNNNNSLDTNSVIIKIDEVLKQNGASTIKRNKIVFGKNKISRNESNVVFLVQYEQIKIIEGLQNILKSDSVKVQGNSSSVKGRHQIHLLFKKKIFETINLQFKKREKDRTKK